MELKSMGFIFFYQHIGPLGLSKINLKINSANRLKSDKSENRANHGSDTKKPRYRSRALCISFFASS